jgi:hypothetical protein
MKLVGGTGKKPPTKPPKPNGDAVKRMNYLFQAAHALPPEYENLQRFYMSTIKTIAQRLVIRLFVVLILILFAVSPHVLL